MRPYYGAMMNIAALAAVRKEKLEAGHWADSAFTASHRRNFFTQEFIPLRG